MINTINYTSFGEDLVLSWEFSQYTNGRLALQFWVEQEYPEPFAKVTVNMPDVHLNEGEVLIKSWAENGEFVAWLVEQGHLIPTGREVASGFVFPMVATLGETLLQTSKEG